MLFLLVRLFSATSEILSKWGEERINGIGRHLLYDYHDCTLGGLLGKPVEQLVKKMGIKSGATKEQIVTLYTAANYHGTMFLFPETKDVKAYLIRALEKAPELILK